MQSVLNRTLNRVIDHNAYASLIIIIAGALYGTMAYFGVMLMRENMSVPTMLFWRYVPASVIMLIWLIFRGDFSRFIFSLQSRSGINLASNVLFYAGSSAFFFMGSRYTGTGITMSIFFAYPFFVALLSFVTRESRLTHYIALALSILLIGLYLLKGSDTQELNLAGIIFAILSAACYGLYMFNNRKQHDGADSYILTAGLCLGHCCLFFIIAACTQTFSVPHDFFAYQNIISLSIIGTLIPILLTLEGLKRVDAIKASILSVFEPVVTVMIGIVLLHEQLTIAQFLGVTCLLLASIIVQLD